MIIGQYTVNVGSGNRVSFPKKFRQVVGRDLVITKGLDGNILIVARENWRILLEGTENKPLTNTDAREMQTLMLGNASEVTLDELGRFVIPEYLRTHAGITHEVIFAGIERYIQLWDKKRWEEYQVKIVAKLRENDKKLPGIE